MIDWHAAETISVSTITLFIGFFLNRLFEKKPKVVCYFGNASGILLRNTDPPLVINTHSIVIRNMGNVTATDLRIGHNYLPDFQVFPDIDYTVADLPGGGKEIRIPNLIPSKQINITYLYKLPTTLDMVNTHFESAEGSFKLIRVIPTEQLPQWLNNIIGFLIVFGVVSIIYIVYEIILKLA